MSLETLLSKLDKVKRTGPDRWVARCPAHEDRTPSLAVRALDDGRTLVYCRAGCGVGDVLSAVGLEIDSLYPEKPTVKYDGKPNRERRPFSAEDVLRCLDFESTLVLLAAQDVLAGKQLSIADRDRLAVAVERINLAKGVVWTN